MPGSQEQDIIPGDLVRLVGLPESPALFAIEVFSDTVRVLASDGDIKIYWYGDLEVISLTPRTPPKDV